MRESIAAIALFAAACAPSSSGAGGTTSAPAAENGAVPAPTPADVRIRISQAQNGQTISVPVNQRFAVELVGVPTAGFVWAPAAMPSFLTRAGDATGDTSVQQSKPGFTGGNHWEVLMFAATGPGHGDLVIEQRRPWEHDQPPAQTFRVTIDAR